jgi:hypothetical protein
MSSLLDITFINKNKKRPLSTDGDEDKFYFKPKLRGDWITSASITIFINYK